MHRKWKNKSHEYDEAWTALKRGKDRLAIHVIGEEGYLHDLSTIIDQINPLFNRSIRYIVPNEFETERSMICGNDERLFTVYQLKDDIEGIVVPKLISLGLKQFDDFCDEVHFSRHIFPLILLYEYNYLLDEYVQLSVTERCTLRCEKCAHFCNYPDQKGKIELSLIESVESIDRYFSVVDRVRNLDILGGEPLLYPYLADVIRYLNEKYVNRIGIITITSNGTVAPDNRLMEELQNSNAVFILSDYGIKDNRISGSIESFRKILNKYGIRYYDKYKSGRKWVDLGVTEIDEDEKYAQKTYLQCMSGCSEIRIDRYYYCIIARCAAQKIHTDYTESDYLDMRGLDPEDGKKIFYEYSKGFNEKGYLEMCRHCRGMNASDIYHIEPGIQME